MKFDLNRILLGALICASSVGIAIAAFGYDGGLQFRFGPDGLEFQMGDDSVER